MMTRTAIRQKEQINPQKKSKGCVARKINAASAISLLWLAHATAGEHTKQISLPQITSPPLISDQDSRTKHKHVSEGESESRIANYIEAWDRSSALFYQGRYNQSINIAAKTCPPNPIDSHIKAFRAFMCWFLIGRAKSEAGEYSEAQSFLLASRGIYEAVLRKHKTDFPNSTWFEILTSNALATAYFGQGLRALAEKEVERSNKLSKAHELPEWKKLIDKFNYASATCKTAAKCVETILPYIDKIEEMTKQHQGGEEGRERAINLERLLIFAQLTVARNYNALGESLKALSTVNTIEDRITKSSTLSLTPAEKKMLALAKAQALNGTNRFREAAEYLSDKLVDGSNISEKELETALSLEMAHAYIALGDEAKSEFYAIKTIRLKSELIQEVTQSLPADERYQYREQLTSLEGIYPFALKSKAGLNVALLARLNEYGVVTEVDKRKSVAESNSKSLNTQREYQSQYKPNIVGSENERFSLLRTTRATKLTPGQLVTAAAIAEQLSEKSIMVEYKKYYPFTPDAALSNRWGTARYMAMAITDKGESFAVDLGPETEINELISGAIISSEQNNSDSAEKWLDVAKRVLDPIITSTGRIDRVFITPDGELNRIPFTAIPAMKDEDLEISILPSGRSLLMPTTDTTHQRQEPLILAAPEYGEPSTGERHPDESDQIEEGKKEAMKGRNTSINERNWETLPGALKEGELVHKIIGGRLQTGNSANHETLRAAQSPVILHFATHSYFTNALEREKNTPGDEEDLHSSSSLIQSGIVLAGANSRGKVIESVKSYITAHDASYLSLDATELVVVSGCESGLGSIRVGEGVYGLARGFSIAGSKSTLVSLWKIDDSATAEFMTVFYRRLKSGKSRISALLSTQKDFRDGIVGNGQWREPYYWAAWQLVGDWRPIKGL